MMTARVHRSVPPLVGGGVLRLGLNLGSSGSGSVTTTQPGCDHHPARV